MPFDWKAPFGYVVAWLIEVAAVYTTLTLLYLMVTFIVGTCWTIIDILKDITNDIAQLNAFETSNESRAVTKTHFCCIVKFYSYVRELSVRKI